MKRNLLKILLLAAVFYSCKKEHNMPAPTNQSSKSYNINFNVGFTETTDTINNGIIKLQSIGSKATATVDTLINEVSVINYQVYDSTMHAIRYITTGPDTAFGKFSTELPTGTYTVIIAAGGTNFGVGEYEPSMASFAVLGYSDPSPYLPPGTAAGYFTYAPFKANTFYKKFTLTVGASGASYAVNLDRIVGQLKVVVQDRIPSEVQEIVVQVYGDAMDKNIFTLAPDYYMGNYYYSFTDNVSLGTNYITTGAENTTFYIPIGNTTTPFSVEIQATNGYPVPIEPFEPARVIYDDKTITGVTCANNETTVLTGNLFTSGSNNSGFTISYDPTWNTGNPTTINFNASKKSR